MKYQSEDDFFYERSAKLNRNKASARAVEFAADHVAASLKLRIAIFAFATLMLLGLLYATKANAGYLQNGGYSTHAPSNACALFYSKQQNKRYDVVQVSILGANQGKVEVMILGLPKKVSANVNGIDVSRNLAGTKQIQCGREAVGEYRLYDLSRLNNMEAGFFQVTADNLQDGKSLNFK